MGFLAAFEKMRRISSVVVSLASARRGCRLARIIHASQTARQKMFWVKQLQLLCPEHRANQPPRVSVRFLRDSAEPAANAVRLMNDPG